MKVQKYVVGFLFDQPKHNVALVKKTRPEWQKGCWNGIGGKIEEHTATCRSICGPFPDCDQTNFSICDCHGEKSSDAMRREFREETGVDIESWTYFATLEGRMWRVDCYFAVDSRVWDCKTTTDEEIEIIKIDTLSSRPRIDNLNWLIPMALYEGGKTIYRVQDYRA